ncbi:hypothetical protein E4U54_005135 [Claviceps lovelessii]|nr:hypothetical protein E4U54_005135 [Claviceps lovelessii]
MRLPPKIGAAGVRSFQCRHLDSWSGTDFLLNAEATPPLYLSAIHRQLIGYTRDCANQLPPKNGQVQKLGLFGIRRVRFTPLSAISRPPVGHRQVTSSFHTGVMIHS